MDCLLSNSRQSYFPAMPTLAGVHQRISRHIFLGAHRDATPSKANYPYSRWPSTRCVSIYLSDLASSKHVASSGIPGCLGGVLRLLDASSQAQE
jgi:hypothetical protein